MVTFLVVLQYNWKTTSLCVQAGGWVAATSRWELSPWWATCSTDSPRVSQPAAHIYTHTCIHHNFKKKKSAFAENRHIYGLASPTRTRWLWPFVFSRTTCTCTHTHQTCQKHKAGSHVWSTTMDLTLNKVSPALPDSCWKQDHMTNSLLVLFHNSSVLHNVTFWWWPVLPAALPALIRWPIRIFCSLTGEPRVAVFFQTVVDKVTVSCIWLGSENHPNTDENCFCLRSVSSLGVGEPPHRNYSWYDIHLPLFFKITLCC